MPKALSYKPKVITLLQSIGKQQPDHMLRHQQAKQHSKEEVSRQHFPCKLCGSLFLHPVANLFVQQREEHSLAYKLEHSLCVNQCKGISLPSCENHSWVIC